MEPATFDPFDPVDVEHTKQVEQAITGPRRLRQGLGRNNQNPPLPVGLAGQGTNPA
jgi:hypothetical protein